MRSLAALLCLIAAAVLACVAYPLAWAVVALRRLADRLRQGSSRAGQLEVPDAACWAAICRHEQAIQRGEARWQ